MSARRKQHQLRSTNRNRASAKRSRPSDAASLGHRPEAPSTCRAPASRLLLPLLLVLCGSAAYANSLRADFVFDDVDFEHDASIRDLTALGTVLGGTRRPVVNVTLAVNYALGALEPAGYHIVNIAIHLLAGLVLYGLVRRTLLLAHFRGRLGASASWLAFAVALLWTLHPLQTQAVTYTIQRAESLMGLFYLLTMYCVIRGVAEPSDRAPRRLAWFAAAIAACGLGMGSKGVMVTAPVVVLLFDWLVITRSLPEVLRRRWGLYLCLAATWIVLGACGVIKGTLDPSRTGVTVGLGVQGITPFEYLRTQAEVVLHYLTLAIWPGALCLDYKWPFATGVLRVALPGAVMAALAVGTVWAAFRKPWLGFLGAWFFLILSPTSSIIPIKDAAFEHRMYLPLAAVVAVAVFATHWMLRRAYALSTSGRSSTPWISVALLVIAAAALGATTARRNTDYHSRVAIWDDAVAKRPANWRAHCELARALAEKAKTPAIQSAGKAKALREQAFAGYREALRLKPNYPLAHYDFGNALLDDARFEEAAREYRIAIRQRPDYVQPHIMLGNALQGLGKHRDAQTPYQQALELNPEHGDRVRAHFNLGNAHNNVKEYSAAIARFREAIRLDPQHAKAHHNLGIALMRSGSLLEAVEAYQSAIGVNPRYDLAYFNLGIALGRLERTNDAIDAFRRVLQLKPTRADAHYHLAKMLAKQGKTDEAAAAYREALRINPGHKRARKALEALAAKGAS